MIADLFDAGGAAPAPAPPATSRRDKPGVTSSEVSTPCPVRVRGKRCARPVSGIDQQRSCARCYASGAPARVPWELAKPEGGATVLPELVLVLANAGMSETAVHAPTSAKDEVGSFKPSIQAEPPPAPDFGVYPCGHRRAWAYGFCGVCNPARL